MPFEKKEYFLGCVSRDGFTTHFGKKIADKKYFTYILKGGPGTGKSTLMKRIATYFSNKDDVEVYNCASDPNSVDAVVLDKGRSYNSRRNCSSCI